MKVLLINAAILGFFGAIAGLFYVEHGSLRETDTAHMKSVSELEVKLIDRITAANEKLRAILEEADAEHSRAIDSIGDRVQNLDTRYELDKKKD